MKAPKHRVLVVDGDPASGKLLARYLRESGMEVDLCRDGRAAIDIVKSTRPDAVVLDVLLPSINGFEVSDSIKADPETKSIPVMMVTSIYISENDIARGLRIGSRRHTVTADLVMGKPVSKVAFVRHTLGLIGDREALEQLAAENMPLLLAVDDDPGTLRLLRRAFDKQNYRVLAAASGKEALDMFRREPPAVVVLDVRLPDMSGLEVCGIMKAERPETSVVLITSYGSELIAVEAMRKHADDYLSKPLNLAEMGAVVAENVQKCHIKTERDRLVQRLRYSNATLMNQYEELLRVRADLEKRKRESGPAARRSKAA